MATRSGVSTGRFAPVFLLDNGLEAPSQAGGGRVNISCFYVLLFDVFLAAVGSAKTPFRPPTRQGIGAAHDCKGLPSPNKSLAGSHTFANACDFRDGSPNPPLLIYVKQLPRCFGRIASWVKPYSSHLPLSGSSCTVPSMPSPERFPRYSRATAQRGATVSAFFLAFRLSVDFPCPMFHSG